jgi:putative methylase
MRLRHLAMALSRLPPHPQRDVELEQYATEGDFAARWVAEIVQGGDLDETTRVVDLGAGNGILGIACHLAGCASVLLVEIDSACLHEQHDVEWLNADVGEWGRTDVDLVVMNPPWGVQIPRADRPFLEAAFTSEAKVIHLLHSARATHLEALGKSHGWTGEVILSGQFRLPPQYDHHAAKDAVTDVSVWRFTPE